MVTQRVHHVESTSIRRGYYGDNVEDQISTNFHIISA